MTTFNIPKREYCDGPKKMASIRLPKKLTKKLVQTAKDKGWTVTDLICTVLDQFLQMEEDRRGRR